MGVLRPVRQARLPRLPPRRGSRAAVPGVHPRGRGGDPAAEVRLRRADGQQRDADLDPGRHQRRAVPGRAGQAEPGPGLGHDRLCQLYRPPAVSGGGGGRVVPAAYLGLPAARAQRSERGRHDRRARHRVQHVGAGRCRPGPRADTRAGPFPRGLPAQRPRRRSRVLPLRTEQPACPRCQRRHLRLVRRLVRGGPQASPGRPGNRHRRSDQPGVQLLLPGQRSPGRITSAGWSWAC